MVLPGMNAVLDEYLRLLSDGQAHTNKGILEHFYKKFEMTSWEKRDRTSGGTVKIRSRRNWAKSTLKSNGLITYLPNKQVKITPKGHELLASKNPITQADLKNIPGDPVDKEGIEGIDEKIEDYVKVVKRTLCDEVLNRLNQIDPNDFERIVVALLEAMNYGKVGAAPKNHNGGINGVVPIDPLGTEKVYVQARQQKADVGPDDVQTFAGAISAQKSQKGVFITTSGFSSGALEFAKHAGSTLVLIDGNKLVDYMYDYGVGFSEKKVDLKQIDDNYFSDYSFSD